MHVQNSQRIHKSIIVKKIFFSPKVCKHINQMKRYQAEFRQMCKLSFQMKRNTMKSDIKAIRVPFGVEKSDHYPLGVTEMY